MTTPNCPPTATNPSSAHATVRLLLAALVFVVLAPPLTMRGMSLDGVVYATISRNMAFGIGDTWQPIYTSPPNVFYEHPPLAFVLESLMFRLLGDQFWVERLYSILTGLPSIALVMLIWRRLVSVDDGLRGYCWLGVAMWLLMPAWYWIYRNNLLENTLCVFTLLSLYATLSALSSNRWWLAWTAVSAAGIAAAVLTKGPIGLFPLAAPLLGWVALRRQGLRRSLAVQSMLVVFLAVLGALVLAHRPARDFLATYFNQQVVDSLQGRRELVRSQWGHFEVLVGLLRDLWLPAGLTAAAVYFARNRLGVRFDARLRGPFIGCLLMAFSASLPIMISPKQSTYYAAPSWPLFCLTMALWSVGSVQAIVRHLAATPAFGVNCRRARTIALGGMAVSLICAIVLYGRSFRDQELIDDVDRIGQIVGSDNYLAIPAEIEADWALRAYLYRWYYISLEGDPNTPVYRLDRTQAAGKPAPGGTLEVRLARYQLSR